MTEPFADADRLRASFGNYESAPEDHVIWRDFPERCEVVFPERVGPFVVPRAGHFLQWERAEPLNRALAHSLAGPLA